MEANSPSIGGWTIEYAQTGDAQKRTCPARITTEGNDLKQQTAPHSSSHPGEGYSEQQEPCLKT